ncbi:N-acetylglucosamine 6-phosphate deacetylase [Loktanella atrilutea]|uniref:N-acetylglucosamine 6-phosphate deacetylase n=1 Tax=Loktanella atrilutea TaxID=366533 RepID=A0A1M5D6W7_LOKAT|nr:N-acetylglucosamine-6-phosphate deacetylase [Loktanella atrilutea]SHF62789.1 N-acetylglucosamine 6-phosphate deacetylase [Loktanella atrilutea]
MNAIAYTGCDIHDGNRLHPGAVLVMEDDVCAGIESTVPPGARVVTLDGGTLCPGLVDLQVNGGGGVMFNDAPTVETLRTIAEAHRRMGTTALLPTLITDRRHMSRAAIAAAVEAVGKVPGIIGLHLEGPHLSQARKGAHDASLIRPLDDDDMAMLCTAAAKLPKLMLTVAAETVTPAQIAQLSAAGVIVSLGHSDAGFEACRAAFAAGARCTTHLFNAMSGLGHREPGLVGATLDGAGAAGIIADGIHVHPTAIRAALHAKVAGSMFLVSDAMAPAGTDIDRFTLNGREILRRGGRLTLADGTLAGADLSLPQAIRVMVNEVGISREQAIVMATAAPAGVLRHKGSAGHLTVGARSEVVHLAPDLSTARPLTD